MEKPRFFSRLVLRREHPSDPGFKDQLSGFGGEILPSRGAKFRKNPRFSQGFCLNRPAPQAGKTLPVIFLILLSSFTQFGTIVNYQERLCENFLKYIRDSLSIKHRDEIISKGRKLAKTLSAEQTFGED